MPSPRDPAQRRRFLQALAALPLAGAPASVFASSTAVPWPRSQPTPALALPDLNGREWELASLKGKVVVVNFWATWCEPCRAEMPSLQSMAELYGNDVVVLAVNFKERDTRAASFAKFAGITLPMLMDRDGAVAARWGVKVFPSTVLIGRDGQARLRVTGEVDWTGREAAQWIEPLLK
ncbi:MAG: TlpA disulfide reductase family protein [Burkholderiaceae bacterium]